MPRCRNEPTAPPQPPKMSARRPRGASTSHRPFEHPQGQRLPATPTITALIARTPAPTPTPRPLRRSMVGDQQVLQPHTPPSARGPTRLCTVRHRAFRSPARAFRTFDSPEQKGNGVLRLRARSRHPRISRRGRGFSPQRGGHGLSMVSGCRRRDAMHPYRLGWYWQSSSTA